MSHGITTIVVPVKHLDEAKAVYGELLGSPPYMDAPYYVGFRVGDLEIGLDPHGHDHGGPGPVCYYTVDDIEASLRRLQDAGAHTVQDPKDVGGGKLTGLAKDADGNVFGLMQEP